VRDRHHWISVALAKQAFSIPQQSLKVASVRGSSCPVNV
jgi:hypothetical protein